MKHNGLPLEGLISLAKDVRKKVCVNVSDGNHTRASVSLGSNLTEHTYFGPGHELQALPVGHWA